MPPKPPSVQSESSAPVGFRRLARLCLLSLATGAALAEEFATGYLPDDPAVYAATPLAPRYRAWVPPEKDLSAWFPTPSSQGKQGSCAAWATAYAARAYYAALGRGSPPAQPDQRFSPAFVYNQIKLGSCHGASRIGDALKLMQNTGAATWADFPYDPADCSRQPGSAVTARAARYTIDGYERLIDFVENVEATDLHRFKEQIADGNPVIFGMGVANDFFNLKSGIYNNLSDAGLDSGHAMVLVGYSDPKQAFKVINSWGTNWGDKGFGWISYAALQKRINQAYVIKPKPGEDRKPSQPPPRPDVEPEPIFTPRTPTLGGALTPAGLDRLLDELAGPELCGRVRGQLRSAKQVTLTGFVGRERDLDPIEQALEAKGLDVTRDIAARPWPQCEVLVNLHEPLGQPRGLKVNVSGATAAELARGETIRIEVTTPNTPSYVYLTYVQADGNAVHLTRPPGRGPTPLPPNTRLVFGDGEDGRDHYKVGPPYGPEVVVAIATPQPLFKADLPPSQIERDYLDQFRDALRGRGASAAVATLTTHAR